MLFTKTAISNLLYGAKSMIETASKDPVIHAALLARNYTDPKIEALKTTWKDAKDATKAHKRAVADQIEKGVKFDLTRVESNKIYMTHLRYAKNISYKNPELRAKLGLNVARKKKLHDWLLQATVFYAPILEDETLVTAFDEKFGETREALEAGEQAIANTETERQEYNAMIGNSQALREERDVKLEQLDRDISGFMIVLKRAMKDNMQHLEKVGILVYTKGYKKKKKETDPPATEPPATEPPSAEPPATEPPATEPPVTDPPTTDPPTTDPVHDPNPGQ